MSKVQLYSDIFEVTDVDPHGKKFDKVSRIVATSENIDMELTLDINSEIYPMSAAEKFTIVLATSITDGGPNDREAWRDVSASAATNAGTGRGATAVTSKKTLADDFDYVMHGKVFKFDDTGGSKVSVYASFGGLLMCLAGDYRALQDINVGMNLYLLIRK